MAIPGLKPTLETRAKVRIGVKKKSASGKEYPAAVDHFVCDDAEYLSHVGHNAKVLRVYLPFADNEQNFSTGLEWWRGKQLTCYSKGDTVNGVNAAYRVESMTDDARIVSDEMKGKERRVIECLVRDCPHMKNKDCKPMGRLQFFIDGISPQGGVFQLDTKSWNTIEGITGLLALYPDPRGVPFLLKVEMVQKGRDKFPVITLEADVEVTSDNIDKADHLAQCIGTLEMILGDDSATDLEIKQAMCDVLDLTHTGWRERGDFLLAMKSRIEKDGLTAAARMVLKAAVK